MRSAAFQGGGYVLVEFQPSTDLATALQDTRSKVQDAKADLPQAAEEPTVTEVNISEFPVLVVTLSGERAGARADGRRARAARPHRGGARRSRRHAAGRARRSRRGRHRSDEAVVLRAAARPADPGRRRLQQPGRGRQHRGLAGQIRRQGAVADRDAGGCRQPAGGRRPQCRGAGQGHRDGALDLHGCRDDHPPRRQAGHRHRGQEAHRRQSDRHARPGEGGGRHLRQDDAGRHERHLHAGQVGLRQPAARRPAEPRA